MNERMRRKAGTMRHRDAEAQRLDWMGTVSVSLRLCASSSTIVLGVLTQLRDLKQ
jgi:hypothetical protein